MTKDRKKTGGRAAGTPNRFTTTVKETVLQVFQELQQDPNHSLLAFAKKNKRDFYLIAAKLIPTEVTGNIKQTFDVVINDN